MTELSLAVVGQRAARIEARAKVSGRGQYAADLERPRMLYARLVRSPHAHANVVGVDEHAALAVPGAHCVLSASTIAQRLPKLRPFDLVGHHRESDESRPGDMRLFDARVRYAGQPVAAVVA